MSSAIKRLLIANRGEIACRVIRTAESMGIETVAVCSEADARAQHVKLADQAVCIGAPPATESYLNIDAIVDAAKATGADAVHPGYGFLSENAAFAQAVADAGLIFVGPTADVIEKMGDKRTARHIAADAGVPLVPGFDGDDSDPALLKAEAERIGVPLMIKATAGGGGRGLRRVDDLADFDGALESARREAGAAFGDSGILLERMVENARHVEVQVLGDTHGKVVHLFERDCSSQRRHQKVIEEAPCATISDQTRKALTEAAVSLATAVGYTGAGTVEFLVDDNSAVYFLEMNTRLQVEHPVTELITGIDLVAAQLRVAAGEPLGFDQKDIGHKGHAIEARLYAEDPAHSFMPQTGTLGVFELPLPPGCRLDSGVEADDTVSPFYDPMLAKLIAVGATRNEARERLLGFLKESRIAGVATNKGWLVHLLGSADFINGTMRTGTLDQAPTFLPMPAKTQAMHAAAGLQAEALQRFPNQPLAGWRTLSQSHDRRVLEVEGDHFTLDASQQRTADGWQISVTCEDETRTYEVTGAISRHKGKRYRMAHYAEGTTHHFDFGSRHTSATDITHAPADKAGIAGTGQLTAPMDGQVIEVAVKEGAPVKAGDLVCVIEAMKMEHHIRADMDGTLKNLRASVGQQVKNRAPLAIIEPGETA